MRKRFRKIFAFILVCAISVTTFFGCSQDLYPNDKSPISIDLWYYYSGKLGNSFETLIESFNNTVGEERNIIIEGRREGRIEELSKKLFSSANKEVGADAMPEMFMTYGDTACGIDKITPLASLDDYFSAEELSEYENEYIAEGRINSASLKVFPIAKATETIIVDIDRWNEFEKGYNKLNPQTPVALSDFETDVGILSAAQKYYEYSDGKALFCRDGIDNYFLTSSMQLGEELYTVDETGKIQINFNKQVTKTLWDNYYIPYIKGYYSHVGMFGTDCVSDGEVMAALTSTSASAFYPNKNLKVIKAPIVDKNAKKIFTQQGAGLSVIKSNKRVEEACALFLKWFTQAERNIEFSTQTGYLPVKKAANNYEEIKEHIGANANQAILDTIKIAIDMVESSESMYACKPAVSSEKIRNLFKLDVTNQDVANQDFITMCKKDIATLNAIIKKDPTQGKNSPEYQNALAEKISENNFEVWYVQTKNRLNKIVNDTTIVDVE